MHRHQDKTLDAGAGSRKGLGSAPEAKKVCGPFARAKSPSHKARTRITGRRNKRRRIWRGGNKAPKGCGDPMHGQGRSRKVRMSLPLKPPLLPR